MARSVDNELRDALRAKQLAEHPEKAGYDDADRMLVTGLGRAASASRLGVHLRRDAKMKVFQRNVVALRGEIWREMAGVGGRELTDQELAFLQRILRPMAVEMGRKNSRITDDGITLDRDLSFRDAVEMRGETERVLIGKVGRPKLRVQYMRAALSDGRKELKDRVAEYQARSVSNVIHRRLMEALGRWDGKSTEEKREPVVEETQLELGVGNPVKN